MAVLAALRLFACNALWRTTGMRPAGRALVRALASEDEDRRTIAGMFLVQAGRRADPLLREAIARRENLPFVLAILGDIGDPKAEPLLRELTGDADPEVADAARQALRVLAAQARAAAAASRAPQGS